MRHALGLAAGVVAVFVCASIGSGGVPPEFNFQGILTDANGDPADDGTHHIRYRIYDAAEGGNVLWESDNGGEQYVPVTVVDGLYNYLLGSHGPCRTHWSTTMSCGLG